MHRSFLQLIHLEAKDEHEVGEVGILFRIHVTWREREREGKKVPIWS
jgi:hypothetical protein